MRLVSITSLIAAASADPLHIPRGEERANATISHHEVMRRYRTKVTSWKALSADRKSKMTPHQAIKNLAGHLSRDQQRSLTALVSADPGVSNKSTLEKLTEAVKEINKMYLSLDKERVTTETACVIDLEHMYKTDDILNGEATRQKQNFYNLQRKNLQLQNDIETEVQKLEKLKEEHRKEEGQNAAELLNRKVKDLKPLDADVKLYEFIAEAIEDNCKDGKGFKMFTQETDGVCMPSASAALVSIFSSPELKAKVDNLPLEVRQRFDEEVAALGGDAEEEENSFEPLVFLQKGPGGSGGSTKGLHDGSSTPIKDVSKSKWATGSSCGDADVKCDDLRTIIGIELVCKRKAHEAMAKEIADLEEEHNQAALENSEEAKDQREVIDSLRKAEGDNKEAQTKAWRLRRMAIHHLIMHIHKTIHREHECHDRLEEIYGSTFCSCGALKDFMKSSAIKAYKGAGKKVDVQDCEWEEKFKPDEKCEDASGAQVDCIKGDVIPHGQPDKLPKRAWTRDVLKQPNDHPLALQCPDSEALNMMLVCNAFLCPVDCKQGPYLPEQAECSSKCTDIDDGVFTQTSKIQTDPKYGGEECDPVTRPKACIDRSECPVDCKQIFSYYDCGEACNTGREQEFVRIGSRRRRWNSIRYKRTIVSPRFGGKACLPQGKALYKKSWDARCSRRAARRCSGSEKCFVDQRDIIVAYECSAGMQDGFGESSCRRAINLVRDLITRVYTSYFGAATARVALIKFGNGMAKRENEKVLITDVQLVSPFTGNVAGLAEMLKTDDAVDKDWHYGFANFNQLFTKAKLLFSKSDPPTGAKRTKSLVILTKGKRVECSTADQVAHDLRKDGVRIHVALFSHDYKNSPDKFAAVKDLASFPASLHFSHFPGYSWLHTTRFVRDMVPTVCSKAKPSWFVDRFKRSYMPWRPVHVGATCASWRVDLFGSLCGGRRKNCFRRRNLWLTTPYRCARIARQKGFKGAIYMAGKIRQGRRRVWHNKCLVHPTLSKDPQVKADGTANDETCKCVARDGKDCNDKYNKRSQLKGWSQQVYDVAQMRPWRLMHFRTRLDGAHAYKNMATQDGGTDSQFTGVDPVSAAANRQGAA
jgi:hypothetical protein